MIEHMLEEGGTCYPFSVQNFAEAMANMPERKFLGVIAALRSLHHDCPKELETLHKVSCADTLKSLCEEYWRDMATSIVEKER